MKIPKIYAVGYSADEFSDYYEKIIFTTDDESKAYAWMEKFDNLVKKCKIHYKEKLENMGIHVPKNYTEFIMNFNFPDNTTDEFDLAYERYCLLNEINKSIKREYKFR